MSEGDGPPNKSTTSSPNAEVGYRKPPVEHRFKKGASGNPRGRPRKRRVVRRPYTPTLEDLVMAEAYRPITIRENNEPVTLPMIQAVARNLGVAAVKGSHRAQIAITGMVQAIEERQYIDKRTLMETILEYKAGWKEAFEQCDREGTPRPDPLPHPDDLFVDINTGEVIYNGPFDEAQKAAWDKLKQMRQDAAEEIDYFRRSAKRTKSPHRFQAIIDQDERTIERYDNTFPAEDVRRVPGFNIHEWRQHKQTIQEIKDRYRRQRERSGMTE